MFRILSWFLAFCFAIGLGEAFGKMTVEMAGAAAHAFQHDQLNYAEFTRELWAAKPRKKPAERAPEIVLD